MGAPSGERFHHVLVSVFDARKGSRLTDLEVKARIGELGLAETVKRLEPMVIGDTVTYGNYFSMPAAGPYIIRVEMRRPGEQRWLHVEFEYRHIR